MKAVLFSYTIILAIVVSSCTDTGPSVKPTGQDETLKTSTLEVGAQILQTNEPAEELNVYLVGFHPLKKDPSKQLEAHHFCKQVNEDFAQCALFDGNTAQSNLNGIEYIISKKLYDRLPTEEKKYWHPHNYEILSGQLIAPGLPDTAEHELMKSKMNSYGKTWHVWNTGHYGESGDKIPLGEPMLAWSFNRDGEALPGLIEERDTRMDVSMAETRRNRQDLVKLARPQGGVNAIAEQFTRPTRAVPGVMESDRGESGERIPASVKGE